MEGNSSKYVSSGPWRHQVTACVCAHICEGQRHPWAPYNFSKYARQAGPPAFKAQPSPLPNLLSKDYRCSPPCPAFDL